MNISSVSEEYGIYGMLFSLSNRIQTIGDKEFDDITMKQHFMMIALEMFEQPPALTEMGAVIGCSYQNVKRMAEHLQKEQYLTIEKDGIDKRKLLLKSTGKFEKMACDQREKTVKFMENLYRNITQKEMEITLRTLKKMDQNLGGRVQK
ncbi:MarR family winged helix-turn-helix transcriptional regulator [Anaeromicropila populeti]|uniref:MarR family winged helix-turn-helix transcriptional regulator n=1 Tax=Anaeromicropila populeti TaxID=37658 RepID=UPI000B810661|nr:MarR family winged helix-turn-helix transcriptional regulator [Anaeromicropila populeti]